jgi:2-C-methyl-D-erythritol 2,4-cyclodiphosphate synthase
MFRIGHGYDVHKFGGTGPLKLAGVDVPYEFGFIAHSDGDVAYHAVCDALLGALAKGDIGHHFPDTDPQYKGVDSRILLDDVVNLMRSEQYRLGNLDVTIVAQAPKLAPHIQEMRANLASAFSVAIEQINVKATTTEKLGFEGRKEGIAVHAVLLLMQENH